jgi:hypothetical protein
MNNMPKKETTITFNRKEIEDLIIEAMKAFYGAEVDKMEMFTGVEGDYDRGDAKEYLKELIIYVKN